MRATATIRNKPNNNMALRMQPSRNPSREKQAEAMTPPKQPLPALTALKKIRNKPKFKPPKPALWAMRLHKNRLGKYIISCRFNSIPTHPINPRHSEGLPAAAISTSCQCCPCKLVPVVVAMCTPQISTVCLSARGTAKAWNRRPSTSYGGPVASMCGPVCVFGHASQGRPSVEPQCKLDRGTY